MKYYYDLMSQPSRAVYIFLRKNKIPFTECPVALRKGEHLAPEFAKINPFQRVPAIDDDGFKLSESVSILRYLMRKYDDKVADYWFPKNPQEQARVNEYMDWQQWNTRPNCAMYFQHKLLIPLLTRSPPDEGKVAQYLSKMENTLDQFENIWLKDTEYVAGDHLTVADLLAVCELQQPSMVGYNVFENRPKLAAWHKRVKEQLQPEYEEASNIIDKMKKKFESGEIKIPSAKL